MRVLAALSCLLIHTSAVPAQTGTTFFAEAFDSLLPPGLPPGWVSSSNRSPGTPDFTTAGTTPNSPPNAVLSTNATIAQSLLSPLIALSDFSPDTLFFAVRRSASHTAPLVAEFSTDAGSSFFPLGDSIQADGSAGYVLIGIPLDGFISEAPDVIFRWRIIAAATGATGTLRLDDIIMTGTYPSDLGIIALRYERQESGDRVIVTVRNEGRVAMELSEVTLFFDEDGAMEPLGAGMYSGSINPAETAAVAVEVEALNGGPTRMTAVLSAMEDRNPANDTLRAQVFVPFPPFAVVLNEVMYQPLSGGSEYIEIHNPGSVTVDLSGSSLSDRPGSDGSANSAVVPSLTPPVPPGGFLVIGEEETLRARFPSIPAGTVILDPGSLTLNNDGDLLLLTDPAGNIIDSVAYLPSWHHPAVIDRTGRALERISSVVPSSDPKNWSTCTLPEGGSPGTANSISLKPGPEGLTLAFNPNPFSPDGDGFEDAVLIRFTPPPGSFSFSLRVFDDTGRQVRRLATNEPAGQGGVVIWDGTDDFRRKARVGLYIVLLEIHGERGEVVRSEKGVVVLAARL